MSNEKNTQTAAEIWNQVMTWRQGMDSQEYDTTLDIYIGGVCPRYAAMTFLDDLIEGATAFRNQIQAIVQESNIPDNSTIE